MRFGVGFVISGIALYQLYLAGENKLGTNTHADLKILAKPVNRFYQFLAGAFLASTGTGVAEMHQPLFEEKAGLSILRANATAICIEAIADWVITLTNIKMGNLRYDILIFTLSGVLVGGGGQIGPRIAKYLPPPQNYKIYFWPLCYNYRDDLYGDFVASSLKNFRILGS